MAHPVVLLYAGSGSSHKVTEQCCNVLKCIRFNNTADFLTLALVFMAEQLLSVYCVVCPILLSISCTAENKGSRKDTETGINNLENTISIYFNTNNPPLSGFFFFLTQLVCKYISLLHAKMFPIKSLPGFFYS